MRHFILLLFIPSIASFAQTDPHFYTDGFTPFWNNPASTGSWNKFSVNAVYQNQWPSLSGAFQTLNVNAEFDAHWGKKEAVKKFNLPIGLNAMYRQNGPLDVLSFNIPLSLPVKLGSSTVAVGISPGIKHTSTDWTQLTFGDPAPAPDNTRFDLNGGILWYGKFHYAGLSVTNATAPISNDPLNVIQLHAHGGYRIKLGKHYVFPMISASYVDGFIALRSMNYFQFREDVFSVGIGYSLRSNLTAAATVQFKGVKLSYGYNISFSKLSSALGSSHELRLSYSIPKLFDKWEINPIFE